MKIKDIFKLAVKAIDPRTYMPKLFPHSSYLIREFESIESIDLDFRGDTRPRRLESRYMNILRHIAANKIKLDPTAQDSRWGRSEAMFVDKKIGHYGLNYYLNIGGGFAPNNEREVEHFLSRAKEPESKQAYLDWFAKRGLEEPGLH